MKNKLLTLFLALAASVGTLFAETYSGTCGDNLTWTLDTESGILTISGNGAITNYTYNIIYNESNTPWYSSRSSIKTVKIGSSVTSIGDYAFYDCSSLTSITIPNSVISIGRGAFGACSSLTSITIPNSVTSIGSEAFSSCSGLTSISVEEGNAVYDSRNNCNAIIETATNTLIAGCQKTIIPNTVTSIGYYAFSYCSNLTSVTIPNSVTSIGEYAFSSCISLPSITIPNSVTSIGEGAFAWCYSLTSITIPNSVTSIGERAFHSCGCLTSVTIPNSVTSIGDWAFDYCTSLTSITIPNSVTSIGNEAFWDCRSLTSITIPNSVTSIGSSAFNGCSSLTSIIVESGNSTYDSRNNCNAIIETATNTLITGCQPTTIPTSVTSIGDEAFCYCTGLTSITIPNSVTSIGYQAFLDCSSLTSVTIPNSVTSIGSYAFYKCSSLTSITCEAVVSPTLGNEVFYNVDKSIPLYVPAQSIDLYKAADQWKDFTNILPINSSTLPSNITLQENESSDYYTQFANDYNGRTVNTATLNRQFTQGKWATLCLPFDVNKALMTSLGLYNRVFAFRYAQQLDDETIQVFFIPAQSIEAGKGYIVNPNAKLAAKTSFVFPNVTINTDSDNGDITTLTGYNDGTGRGNLFLVGTLRTGMLQGSTSGNTYLGLKDNVLYYPNTTTGTSIRAYRGFFRSETPVNASRVRIIADGEPVSELQVVGTAPSDWSDKSDPSYIPARKYLRNGLLFIERNGITYTAQGQRLD